MSAGKESHTFTVDAAGYMAVLETRMPRVLTGGLAITQGKKGEMKWKMWKPSLDKESVL